jgi:hypothetical protein
MQRPEVRAKLYNPEVRAKIVKATRKRMASPEARAKAGEWLNSWRYDPERREKVVAKTAAKLRGRPWSGTRGGNGMEPTLPEELLLTLLTDEWEWQLSIPTGGLPGYPTSYKVDIGHQERKIAVEIDGSSHRGRQTQDEKKDALLREHGWRVLRFWNMDVLRGAGEISDRLTAMTLRSKRIRRSQ